jgi:hypothetical protein
VPVAFIGDPKQAIYGFRGADVFTYMQAASAAERQFTLTTNWRSESRLIGAVNAIFDREKPFLLDEIQFDRATPGPHADDKTLRIGGKEEAPYLWIAEKNDDPPATSLPIVAFDEWCDDWRPSARPRSDQSPHEHERASHNGGERAPRQRIPSVLMAKEHLHLARSARAARRSPRSHSPATKFVRAAPVPALAPGNDPRLTHDDAVWESELLRLRNISTLAR